MGYDKVTCSECGKEVNDKRICIIDQKAVCFTCLYGLTEPFEIYPIGRIATTLEPMEIDGLPPGSKGISRIDLIPSQRRFMYKLEEETSLLVIYYLHEIKSVTTVFNRRLDGKRVGVFASRSPNRPSKIAVQDVSLLKVDENVLYVGGLDAIDGSPVLDIKLGLRHGNHAGRQYEWPLQS